MSVKKNGKKTQGEKDQKQGVSKVKLAIGAASLFLFIVGLKRTFQMEEPEPAARPPEPAKSD